jgi:hypothetical protein
MKFKKWVKSIQTAGYNGARTVHTQSNILLLLFLPLVPFDTTAPKHQDTKKN